MNNHFRYMLQDTQGKISLKITNENLLVFHFSANKLSNLNVE